MESAEQIAFGWGHRKRSHCSISLRVGRLCAFASTHEVQGANETMASNQSVEATETNTIVPFPVVRRLHAIRSAAAELEDLHGAEALQFWRRRCRALADELFACGCSEEEVRHQVLVFQDEVQIELQHRHLSRLSAGAMSQ